jgi:hypothetical protein
MASQAFGFDLDLEKNELLNASLQTIAGDSAVTSKEGLIFLNTVLDRIRIRVNSAFETVPFVSDAAPSTLTIGQVAAIGSSTRAMRQDATFGLPGYATSGAGGFMSAADKAKLDAAAILATASTLMIRDGNGRSQVADPASGNDIANYSWTMQQIALAKQGLAWKAPVRTIYTSNLAGTYVSGTKRLTASAVGVLPNNDGVTSWVAGDRVALNGQTTGTQNGLYVIIQPGTASVAWILERTADFGGPGSTAGDVYVGAFFVVTDGTEYGDTSWVCSNNTVTIDTTAITFQQDVKAAVDNVTINVNSAGNLEVKDAGISYAKVQNLSACSVLGRSANSTGVSASIAATVDNRVLARGGGVLGFVAVSNAMLATMAARTVKVNATNATAAPTDLAPSAADLVLQANSGNTGLEWGTVRTGGITNDAVTNAKLANMAANTIKGAVSAGDPVDLTPAQVRTIIGSDIAAGNIAMGTNGTLGDGTNTAFTITHGLPAGLNVIAQVYYNSAPYATYNCVVERTATTVTFRFNVAPTANQYRYSIVGAP